MAHTLNEQVVVIPAGTGDVNIELYLGAIVRLTGWTRDGYTVYCDDEHTMGLKFYYSAGSSSCRLESFFNGGTVVSYLSSFSLTSAGTVRVHQSTDETVTYLNLTAHSYTRYIYAVNEDGNKVLFQPETRDNLYAGTASVTSAVSLYLPAYTNNKKYSITKYPDIINGSVFPSLYTVFGSQNSADSNQLVNFDGEIYRFAPMSSDSQGCWFAFPVSDETEQAQRQNA